LTQPESSSRPEAQAGYPPPADGLSESPPAGAMPPQPRARRFKRWHPAVAVAAIFALAAGSYLFVAWQRDRAVEARLRRYEPLIYKCAQANGLSADLVGRVIRAESGARPGVESSKHARGLMQITPITEREVLRRTGMPRGDLFEPDYNIRVGTAYLRQLLDRFGGDLHLGVAAYHMGPTRVAKILAEHPGLSAAELLAQHAPASTRWYVRQVLGEP